MIRGRVIINFDNFIAVTLDGKVGLAKSKQTSESPNIALCIAVFYWEKITNYHWQNENILFIIYSTLNHFRCLEKKSNNIFDQKCILKFAVMTMYWPPERFQYTFPVSKTISLVFT
jgi:hypothetical protein